VPAFEKSSCLAFTTLVAPEVLSSVPRVRDFLEIYLPAASGGTRHQRIESDLRDDVARLQAGQQALRVDHGTLAVIAAGIKGGKGIILDGAVRLARGEGLGHGLRSRAHREQQRKQKGSHQYA